MGSSIAHIVEQLLPRATARVVVEAFGRKGTGFFAAPGTLVTCKHVLKGLDLAVEESVTLIDVIGVDEYRYKVEAVRHVSADDGEDLAVLRVSPGDRHPCVLLMPGLSTGDTLHAFGYTAKHPEGVPVRLTNEGMTGNEKLYKLAGGQVQPGMSGAPVVNATTGAVCGILKRTRDELQPLGGYAIPVTTLAALSDAVASQNRTYNVGHPEWVEHLETNARQDWQRGPVAEPGSGPPDRVFLISVTPQEEWWEVRAEVGPIKVGPVQVDLNTVRSEVARMFRDWASPDSSWRGRVDRGEEVRLLGTILSSAVLPLPLLAQLEKELEEHQDGWVLVALRFEPADSPVDQDLEFLPWEHLYVPRTELTREMYVATETGLAFARAQASTLEPSSAPVPRELKVLLISAEPAGEGDLEQEIAIAVRDVASGMEKTLDGKRVRLVPIRSPQPSELMETLRTIRPDVVHYVGYGRYNDGSDEIALHAHRGRHDFVDKDSLAGLLRACPPTLLVLAMCDAPAEIVPVRGDLALFAPPALDKGVDAVVAYQYPLRPDASQIFNDDFYKRLTNGFAVEAAVQGARNVLQLAPRQSRAFLSPALFVRQAGLRLTAEEAESAARRWIAPGGGLG